VKKALRKKEDNDSLRASLYKKAIEEFIHETVQDPSFFLLSFEEQKDKAMKFIQKYKQP